MDERPAADFRSLFFAAYQARPIAAPLELAQQLVFGAVEYARALGSGLGLGPARGFAATTDQTEVVGGPSAISFGCDGKPSFVQGPPDNADAVPQTLERPSGAATSPSWSRHSRKRRRRLRRANCPVSCHLRKVASNSGARTNEAIVPTPEVDLPTVLVDVWSMPPEIQAEARRRGWCSTCPTPQA